MFGMLRDQWKKEAAGWYKLVRGGKVVASVKREETMRWGVYLTPHDPPSASQHKNLRDAMAEVEAAVEP